MYRSNTCNELTKEHVGQEVTLAGWVNRRRDHGGLIFLDLRDRYGLTQVVSDPEENKEAHEICESVRSEFVVQVKGVVRERPEGMRNPNMTTGEIEVLIKEVKILNKAKTPPFEIFETDKEIGEDLRLKYRYLDIRKEKMKNNIIMRHKFIKRLRDLMCDEGFIEVETPILIKGTPEGAREYLVPSRIYPGNFYVLPQSPQQLKQMLMVAGMDKYFQIARCFRDEDQRGDRQPEFTQLDLEMSFVEQEDVMNLNEKVLIQLFEELVPHKKIMQKPFPRMTWHEAMDKYGIDKPDLRFGNTITDVSDLVDGCEFSVFADTVKNGGVVKALHVEGGGKFTRKELDEFTEVAKIYGAKGLAYILLDEEGPRSPIIKFLGDDLTKQIIDKVGAKTGDAIFFGADEYVTACTVLGNVRNSVAEKMELVDQDVLAFCWVYDFPLFEKDENGNLASTHHPFTSPKLEDVELMDTEPEKVRANAYDIALNGYEIGGGSIRIHDSELQHKIFTLLGVSDEQIKIKFSHMLEAFSYGAPPHGGIAWGLDRIIMLLQDEPNIREVIAFPKDQKARDLMTNAPSPIPDAQLNEANVKPINL